MVVRRGAGRFLLFLAAAYCALELFRVPFTHTTSLARVAVEDGAPAPKQGFFTKVVGAAAQGATAAFVAAVLSAMTEPLVNRLLVKRMTFAKAYEEITWKLVSNFFLTTFPTNMLKFPVFEVINIILSFTDLHKSIQGVVNGFLFCTIMLPVTNFRFRRSMGWPIDNCGVLYQAYVPTVSRDIVYGFVRNVVGGCLFKSGQGFYTKCLMFGITVFIACIISSPCNEWRGYTLQQPSRKLPFNEYFKPINYARSTGVGAVIMGIALMVGMMITPQAEMAFSWLKSHPWSFVFLAVAVIVVKVVVDKKKSG